jgi:hypothetical protein
VLTAKRKPLPKNAEILSPWLDYKSTARVRSKVPKSLAMRPGSSKPLNIRSLHFQPQMGGPIGIRPSPSAPHWSRKRRRTRRKKAFLREPSCPLWFKLSQSQVRAPGFPKPDAQCLTPGLPTLPAESRRSRPDSKSVAAPEPRVLG